MEKSSIVAPKIQAKQLTRSDLETFLKSDADIFPSSLTLHTLQSWYDKNPTNFLSHHIHDDSMSNNLPEENLGTLIAIPMKAKPWKELISGKFEEHKITSEMILEQHSSSWSSEDFEQGYGIHIWHVEKSKLWNQFCSTPFREIFWSDLKLSVSVLSSKNMNCIGFSALCATEDGNRTFSKLGFSLKGCFDFTVQNRQGQLKVIHSTEGQLDSSNYEDEWKTIFECGMYVKLNENDKIPSFSVD